MSDQIERINLSIQRVENQIDRHNIEISELKIKISNYINSKGKTEDQLFNEGDRYFLWIDEDLRREEEDLRREEEDLRRKKEDLRREEEDLRRKKEELRREEEDLRREEITYNSGTSHTHIHNALSPSPPQCSSLLSFDTLDPIP
jgi:DNA repair exonuclease SbcCD ATPase subunit